MESPSSAQPAFVDRFTTRKAVERYRDRYRTGRHARVDALERTALRQLLQGVGRLEGALDLPCGTGRMADVLAEASDRVILADAAPLMVEIAREETSQLKGATYLQTSAEKVDLPSASVDLVFCHRLLNHIQDAQLRARMFAELARVSRRYVVVSCYPAGLRTRFKLFVRHLLGKDPGNIRPASRAEIIDHAAKSNLRLFRSGVLRRIPFVAEFLMFERAN